MKKILIILVVLLVGLFFIFVRTSISTKNSEKIDVTKEVDENLPGVSKDNPDMILDGEHGGSIPVEIWTQEIYYFSGSSNYGNLFTNYEFQKGEKYNISVENTGSNSIEVIIMTGIMNKVKEAIVIPGNSTENFSISKTEASEEVYLAFYSNGSKFSFKGYISSSSDISLKT